MAYSHFGCNMRKLKNNNKKKKTLQVHPCKVSCPCWTQQRNESEKKTQRKIWPEDGPYTHTAPLNFILRAASWAGGGGGGGSPLDSPRLGPRSAPRCPNGLSRVRYYEPSVLFT